MYERTGGIYPLQASRQFLLQLRPALMAGMVLLAQCAAAAPVSNAQAASDVCKEATDSGRAGVVKALYRAYPFEAPRVPENEPMDVLRKYFDERFATLLLTDRKCSERTGDLCRLTASLLYAAQDATINDLRVCEPEGKNDWVEVHFLNFGKPQVVFFEVKKTPQGWRVSDMRYDADGSLAKMLSEP